MGVCGGDGVKSDVEGAGVRCVIVPRPQLIYLQTEMRTLASYNKITLDVQIHWNMKLLNNVEME